jgi:hypothetical protein
MQDFCKIASCVNFARKLVALQRLQGVLTFAMKLVVLQSSATYCKPLQLPCKEALFQEAYYVDFCKQSNESCRTLQIFVACKVLRAVV